MQNQPNVFILFKARPEIVFHQRLLHSLRRHDNQWPPYKIRIVSRQCIRAHAISRLHKRHADDGVYEDSYLADDTAIILINGDPAIASHKVQHLEVVSFWFTKWRNNVNKQKST